MFLVAELYLWTLRRANFLCGQKAVSVDKGQSWSCDLRQRGNVHFQGERRDKHRYQTMHGLEVCLMPVLPWQQLLGRWRRVQRLQPRSRQQVQPSLFIVFWTVQFVLTVYSFTEWVKQFLWYIMVSRQLNFNVLSTTQGHLRTIKLSHQQRHTSKRFSYNM